MSVQLAAPRQAIVVGVPTRPGFNGQGSINLHDYADLHPIVFKGSTFSHFEFLDLNTLNLDTESFANLGIREDFEGPDGNRIDELEVSFEQNGFDTSDWPPTRDTNGEWIDGRGRATAAINRGERWLPVAVYSREDTSVGNTVTNGIIGNLTRNKPRRIATFRDIVSGGVHLVHEGATKPTAAAIDEWLLKDLELRLYFKPDLITKMRNSIIEESTRDESLILRKSTKEWHSWVKRNLGLDKKQYVLVNASEKSYNTYIQRVWCESILPAIIDGTDPVDIIFYTSVYRPSEARIGLQMSIEKLDELCSMSFSLVKSQLMASGVNLEALLAATGNQLNSTKPFNIVGACPQIVKGHSFASGKLVDVDKY